MDGYMDIQLDIWLNTWMEEAPTPAVLPLGEPWDQCWQLHSDNSPKGRPQRSQQLPGAALGWGRSRSRSPGRCRAWAVKVFLLKSSPNHRGSLF